MRFLHCTAIISFLFLTAAAKADDVPAWLREAATRQHPSYDSRVPAVVLLDETRSVVDENGKLTATRREAIKILTQEGRADAEAAQVYIQGTTKVRELRAWMISPSGEALKLAKDAEYDRALLGNDLYNDARVRGVTARVKADAGGVFGFESVVEERPLFAQVEWPFQRNLPVVVSRYALTLPAGWRADGIVSNAPGVSPIVDGSTYTWELKNLPYIEPEPASPRLDSLTPRLDVTYYAASAKAQAPLAFTSWTAVSKWLTTLNDASAEPDAATASKARELTASAPSDYQKVQAIGAFVQHIKYVSIQMGIARGGGYKPHNAADVFRNDYGDCKDKAALMRAMLKTVGLTSYPVFVNSNDRSYVRDQWPSPEQFNHVIVAVKLAGEAKAEALVNHPSLGRLLLFDPTNGLTPVGELPIYEQGGLGLVGAGDAGSLITLPMAPAIDNLVLREISASLSDSGKLVATVREEARGSAAMSERQRYYGQSRSDFDRLIERWVAHYANAAVLSQLNATDSFSQGRFGLNYSVEAPAYGQLKAGGRLMVFKPVLLGRREGVFLTAPNRKYPVLLNAAAFRESIRVRLPATFRADELPDPEKLESPFGRYEAKCEVQNGELACSRMWEIRAATVPPQQYQAVQQFYEKILAQEQAAVVLERKLGQ